jgi:glucan phosphoethanolaminetransferase (alkaline phosphatase superfamily)
MKTRNPILVAVFALLTLNIYGFYWLNSTRKTLMKHTGMAVPSIWLLVGPYVVALGVYAAFITKAVMQHPATASGQPPREILYLFLAEWLVMLVLAIVNIYWYLKYGKAVKAYTRGEMGTAVSFLLLFLLGGIGMGIIQDTYNGLDSVPDPATQPASQRTVRKL